MMINAVLESSIVLKSLTCDTGSRVFPIKLMLGTYPVVEAIVVIQLPSF
jgi:hypothetical protein